MKMDVWCIDPAHHGDLELHREVSAWKTKRRVGDLILDAWAYKCPVSGRVDFVPLTPPASVQ